MHLPLEQYELVQSSREVVFKYCETLRPEHLVCNLESFGGGSMRNLLVHIANTYRFWIGNFALKRSEPYFDQESYENISRLRKAYHEVDSLVKCFLDERIDVWAKKVEGSIHRKEELISISRLTLFTHVITHEFHHKGQLMSMSRQLGYKPPDSDIIRFD